MSLTIATYSSASVVRINHFYHYVNNAINVYKDGEILAVVHGAQSDTPIMLVPSVKNVFRTKEVVKLKRQKAALIMMVGI